MNKNTPVLPQLKERPAFTSTQRPSKLAGLTKLEVSNSRHCVGWFNATYRDTFVWGFTLLELLLVITIIAVLSAIAAINFRGSRAKSRDAKRMGDMVQIQGSMESYAASESLDSTYPTAIPSELNRIHPPRNTDTYCYYRRGDGYAYYTAAYPMETDNADFGDETNGIQIVLSPLADEYGEGVRIGAGVTPCLGAGATLDCNPGPDDVYCLKGESKL